MAMFLEKLWWNITCCKY